MSAVMVISSCSRLANAPLFPTYPGGGPVGVGGVDSDALPTSDIIRVGDDPLPCPSDDTDVLADVG